MSKIVGVHGIAQQLRSAKELTAEWLPSLKKGLIEARRQDTADAISDGDLQVSFFGDVFRPPGALSAEFPDYSAENLTSDAEIALVTALYDEAVRLEPGLGEPTGGLGPIRVGVQMMVQGLLQSRDFADLISERAFVGNLKQVTQFLDEPETKEEVLARVHKDIDDSTRILIGHSLGSVVAYEYLCQNPHPGIELLVTLGSPLGIPNVIFERLTPTPSKGGGAWPGAVTSWVNIADPDDVVALRKKLAGLFPPPDGVDRVADESVNNRNEPHAISRYLKQAVTGAALAGAL